MAARRRPSVTISMNPSRRESGRSPTGDNPFATGKTLEDDAAAEQAKNQRRRQSVALMQGMSMSSGLSASNKKQLQENSGITDDTSAKDKMALWLRGPPPKAPVLQEDVFRSPTMHRSAETLLRASRRELGRGARTRKRLREETSSRGAAAARRRG